MVESKVTRITPTELAARLNDAEWELDRYKRAWEQAENVLCGIVAMHSNHRAGLEHTVHIAEAWLRSIRRDLKEGRR